MAQYYFDLGQELGAAVAAAGFPNEGVITTEYLTLSAANSDRSAGLFAIGSDGVTINRGNVDPDPRNGLELGFVSSPIICFSALPIDDFEFYLEIKMGDFEAKTNFTNDGINIMLNAESLVLAPFAANFGRPNCLQIATGANSSTGAAFYYLNGDRQPLTTSGGITSGTIGLQLAANSILSLRMNKQGNRIRRKMWESPDTEPTDWQADFTYSGVPAGVPEIGFLSFNVPSQSIDLTFRKFSLGLYGDVAPTQPVVNPPASNAMFVSGTVTLDGQPFESDVVVTSVEDNPRVLAKGRSNPLGNYNINVGLYEGTVLVNSVQDYGDTWSPSLELETSDMIHPTVPNGYIFKVIQSGVTGITEPTWPATADTQVIDGGVVYESQILLEPVIQGYVQTQLV